MPNYRKKPVVVKAERWKSHFHSRDNGSILNNVLTMAAVPEITPGDGPCQNCGTARVTHGWVKTLEGGHIVCPGDWIIQGVKGEFYPCKPDIFEATYDPVDTPSDS